MAYSKGPTIALKYSASPFPGNLEVLVLRGEDQGQSSSLAYAVAHRGLANVVHIASGVCTTSHVNFEGKEKSRDAATYLTQAKWCQFQSKRTVLVLASYKGFKVMEWDGSSVVYSHDLQPTPTPGSQRECFARGVAAVGNALCVGTSEGAVLVFQIATKGSEVAFTQRLEGHTSPITCLASDSYTGALQLASCDEEGVLIIWGNPNKSTESKVVIREMDGSPCTSLCLWRNFLIGGFGNGLVRIYDATNGSKLVEIAAHARWINSLDVAYDAGLLLSVSEDSTAAVWSLPTPTNQKVSQLGSLTITNKLLCGGRFCNTKGTRFAVSAYDNAEILTFRTANAE